MKPEALEALLVDRALGELPPEVAELLETHLTGNAEAARSAEGLASAIQLARQAVVHVPAAPRRPLAVGQLQHVQMTQRRRSMAWELARLAACAAFGLALGWYGRTLRNAPVIALAPPAAAGVAPAIVAAEPPAGAGHTADFWSLSSLAAAQYNREPVESRATNRYRLRWDSPVRMPRVEENL
jgi:anti-sigma factor RsiW